MKKRLFLGISKHNEVVFANIEVRMNRFSVSFDLSAPEVMTEERFREGCEMYVEGLPRELMLSMLEEWNVSPGELPNRLAHHFTVEEVFDINLFPEVFSLGDSDVYFTASSCGQVNIEDKMDLSLVPSLPVLELVLELWKEYHLETINTDSPKWKEISKSLDRYIEDVSYMDYIQDWIIRKRVDLFGYRYERVEEGVFKSMGQKYMHGKAQHILFEHSVVVPLDTGEGYCPEEVMLFADELEPLGIAPLLSEDRLLDRSETEYHIERILRRTGWEVVKETVSKMDPDYSHHIIDDFGYLRPATREIVDTIHRTLVYRVISFLE